LRLGVRGKLFVTSLVLVLGVGLASAIFLESGLRRWLESRIQGELEHEAATVRVVVEEHPVLSTIAEVDPLADRLGGAAKARVTIIDEDGTVLGDSEQTRSQLHVLENHAGRPEVRMAGRTGLGVARRFSTTLRTEMLFVALPFQRDDGTGTVRVAMPLAEVDALVGRLRFFIFLAALVGLGMAVLMSGLASAWSSRALMSLVDHARAVASGESRSRLEVATADEIGLIAGSFNRLADEVEHAVGDLAAERDRFQTILESMGDAVVALDADDRIELANTAALRLLEQPQARVGQPAVELVRSPGFADMLSRVREADSAAAEFNLPTTPPRVVSASAAAIDDTGSIVVVMHDVTEMRRLERMRRDFVANVSHELRTPISIMRANAETLLDGAMSDPERGPGFAHAIARSAERLGSIVNDLLDLSRIESGQLPLEMRRVPVREQTQQVLDALEGKARDKGITLTNRLAEDLDVHADEGALEQILVNLLDNAIKYTPEGGHVEVRARHEPDGRIALEVADDGPGIELHLRERIFERFYRVDPGRSREMGGTGLGLSIVKHLAEGMGGHVSVHDNEPAGSVFRVTLQAP
jgi:two-component system phosphate regulon sensor histidine kinase PhoR